MPNEKILIVEDEIIVARDIQNTLTSQGYNVPVICDSGNDAILKAEEIKPDLVLMDVMLRGQEDGIDVANAIHSKFGIPIIYLTAYKDDNTLSRAMKTEPFGYLLKPFAEKELHTTIEIALYNHKMELKLKESEDRYRNLVELSPDSIFICIKKRIVFVNKSGLKLLGAEKRNDLVGLSMKDFIHPDYWDINKRNLEVPEESDNSSWIEEKFVRLDGKSIDIEAASSLFLYQGKKALQIVAKDISERKQSEQALKESEEKFRTLAETVQSSIFILKNNQFSYVNSAAEILTEFDRNELTGMIFWKIIHPDDQEKIRKKILVRGNSKYIPSKFEIKIITKTRKVKWIYAADEQILFDKKNAILIAAFDITKIKETEEALMEERERLSVTLKSINDGVIAVNMEGRIILFNHAAERITGWIEREALGLPLYKVFHIINEKTYEKSKDIVDRIIIDDDIVNFESNIVLISKNNKEIVIEESASPLKDSYGNKIGAVIVFRDISEKQKREEEINKMQKLESLGLLAGGIAHDFNNILTAILGNLTLTQLKTKYNDEGSSLLKEAENACWRARELTQQLLTFAKGGISIKKVQDIKELIKSTALFSLRGSNVTANFQFSDSPVYLEVDVGQINQVVQNLIINAREAMPLGGVITITVDRIEMKEGEQVKISYENSSARPGKYVRISIKDEGAGIDPKYIQKIFDPYFTTKQKGSGLGLAIAYSIIKKHGGYINVDSSVGKGSAFYFYLPAGDKIPEVSEKKNEIIVKGKGKILVMDDEEAILNVMDKILKTLGYERDFAKDGEEAINIYKKSLDIGKPFDLIIMDLTVPGKMGGREAAEELFKINPGVKIIISSGYSNEAIISEYRTYGFSDVITKPFNLKELSNKIADIIK